ncbi:hypothetical protein PI125_g17564 [Phytophthora idaei]|nr:hypothetical protein PI125_g17564 [Phytophthora idaei]
MARRAREQLFVLGVDSDGAGRLHVYAYETAMLARDKTVEIGTAKKMPTDRGAAMLEDVVSTGVLPLVLVLQNNHFRAVVYDAQRFKTYQGQRESKIPVVNVVRLRQ